MHQIWVGLNPMSSDMIKWQNGWKEMHPEWEYRLWDNDALNQYHKEFGFINEEQMKECRNFAELSDILRCELIYRYGGVYLDTDFQCLRPTDSFFEKFSDRDLICSPENSDEYLATGFFASIPNHPLLEKLVYGMEERSISHDRATSCDKYGPLYFTNAIPKEMWIDHKWFYPRDYSNLYIDGAAPNSEELIASHPEAYGAHMYYGSWHSDAVSSDGYIKQITSPAHHLPKHLNAKLGNDHLSDYDANMIRRDEKQQLKKWYTSIKEKTFIDELIWSLEKKRINIKL